ncbi:MAG: TonB-dependent receptor, partial [Pseudomonadota bacterium]
PWRLAEPSERTTNLFALESEIDIGDFAQLVTATAITRQKLRTTSDITDLLLDLDYDYELFPAFAGPTNGFDRFRQFNQEVRLVSTHDGPFSWVVGGFYNTFERDFQGLETLPGFPEFAGIDRPDNAEFVQFIDTKTRELAFFGEVAYEVTEKLTITGGLRYYDYQADSLGGQRLPLFQDFPIIESFPIVPPEGTELAELFGGGTPGSASDSGVVWKANISYDVTDDILVYFTYSTGYRIGGANRVAPCPPNVQELVEMGLQQICALPDELQFGPDETDNRELGIKGTFLDGRLTGSLAIYHIGWDGIQLAGATQNGIVGITENGGTAVSKGLELQFTFRATDNWTINGNYAYNDAELTQTVPNLLDVRQPGFPGGNNSVDVDALDGSRLPGSTRNSFLLGTTYEYPLDGDASIIANWTTTYTGNVLTRPGALAGGEVLPSYMLHQASVTYQTENWEVRLYGTNLFDKYAITSVSNDLSRQGLINDGVYLRRYAQSVNNPRNLGIEATIRF